MTVLRKAWASPAWWSGHALAGLAADRGRQPRRVQPVSFRDVRVHIEVVVGENAERRDYVLFKVLVLVVAPDQDEIRIELVQLLPDLLAVFDELLVMPSRVRGALIICELLEHLRRPVRPVLPFVRDIRPSHAVIWPGWALERSSHSWEVAQSEPKDFTHLSPPCAAPAA
jgi:hypothetical protein